MNWAECVLLLDDVNVLMKFYLYYINVAYTDLFKTLQKQYLSKNVSFFMHSDHAASREMKSHRSGCYSREALAQQNHTCLRSLVHARQRNIII